MAVKKVLILGGYGNFGKRIAESLSVLNGITLVIAGRTSKKAHKLCNELKTKGASCHFEAVVVDIYSDEFRSKLNSISPDLVIHTSGPFQGQDYRVPEACVEVGSHYIDLADDRQYVCSITSLNERAQKANVLLISGASSVPGLSSTVVDSFVDQFSQLDEIAIAIAPCNQAERGEATVKGILSYTGHPYKAFVNGQWINKYGWMSPRQLYFGEKIGKRWLANVDVPDLTLFPERYGSVQTVNFQAGLELTPLHFGMVLMALLSKVGLIKNWADFTKPIFKSSELFKHFGSDVGGMQIKIIGVDNDRKPKQIKWLLCAENGVGPYIPTLSAIILAKKLIKNDLHDVGARPCLGLYSMADFDHEAKRLGIYHYEESELG